ncbi:hypothetical protein PVK06_035621 [Gossypium arboreum]|uniref:Uncharacterized protein n=1 Tax=Gossypium arboreum TaxID=29729 RepID=A0ABR0NHB5_GOSAR|nr:hypothetical protein PVK06_035621 [Gossypium arboreum]
MQNQLDIQFQVEEGVKPDHLELKEKVPYMSVEHEDLKVDCLQEMEVEELSEIWDIINEISNSSEIGPRRTDLAFVYGFIHL